MTKAIKISEENYRWLSKIAGKLQQQRQKPVSLDEALSFINKKRKLSDLAGSWKMSNDEHKKVVRDLKKGWSAWTQKSH